MGSSPLGGGGDDSDDGDGADFDAEIAVECLPDEPEEAGGDAATAAGAARVEAELSALRDGLVRQPAVLRVYIAADLARMTSGAAADAGPYTELVAA